MLLGEGFEPKLARAQTPKVDTCAATIYGLRNRRGRGRSEVAPFGARASTTWCMGLRGLHRGGGALGAPLARLGQRPLRGGLRVLVSRPCAHHDSRRPSKADSRKKAHWLKMRHMSSEGEVEWFKKTYHSRCRRRVSPQCSAQVTKGGGVARARRRACRRRTPGSAWGRVALFCFRFAAHAVCESSRDP